jgi:hypothetical protein
MTPDQVSSYCLHLANIIDSSDRPSRVKVSAELISLIKGIESGSVRKHASDEDSRESLKKRLNELKREYEYLNKQPGQLKKLFDWLVKGKFLEGKGDKLGDIPAEQFKILPMLYANTKLNYKRLYPLKGLLSKMEDWQSDADFKAGWKKWVVHISDKKNKYTKDKILKELKSILITIKNYYQAVNRALESNYYKYENAKEQLESLDKEPDVEESKMAPHRDEPEPQEGSGSESDRSDRSERPEPTEDRYESEEDYEEPTGKSRDEILKEYLDVNANPPYPDDKDEWVKLKKKPDDEVVEVLRYMDVDYGYNKKGDFFISVPDYVRLKKRTYN